MPSVSPTAAELALDIAAAEQRLTTLNAAVADSESRAESARQKADVQACLAGNAELQARAMKVQAECLERVASFNACEAKRSQAAADRTLVGCLVGIGVAAATAGLGAPIALGGCAIGRAVGGSAPSCPAVSCELDQDTVERKVLGERKLSELPMCGGYAGLAVKERKVTERLGVKVDRVGPGTTASAVGIARGDILVGIDSRAMRTPADVSSAMMGARVGSQVRVTTVRHEQRLRFEGKVYDLGVDGRSTGRAELGATFAAGAAEVRYADAVEVLRVDGPAAVAGVRVGDVIVGVNGTLVHRRIELQQLLTTRLPAETVVLHVERAGKKLKIEVVLEPRDRRRGI